MTLLAALNAAGGAKRTDATDGLFKCGTKAQLTRYVVSWLVAAPGWQKCQISSPD